MAASPAPLSLAEIRVSVARMQRDILRGTDQVLHALEVRRGRVLAAFREQAAGLVDGVLRRLNVASRPEVADTNAWLASLEQRIRDLASNDAAAAPPDGGGREGAPTHTSDSLLARSCP